MFQVPVDQFHYLTRIHYKSDNVPADGMWGEHEIDYILFIQRNVTVNPNENEVKEHRYVSRQELKEIMGTLVFSLVENTFYFNFFMQNSNFSYKLVKNPWSTG